MTTTLREEWSLLARCQGMGDAMFPDPVDPRPAREICRGCPVLKECLAEALDERIEWGVWGGMTERERRSLLRQRPHVTSWRTVLCS